MNVTFTPAAIARIKASNAEEQTLRIGIRGGGCSGYAYSMQFLNEPKGEMDKEFNIDGQKILIDGISMTYLDGTEVDYVETLEASGFKFNNPNAKTTCGCGKSFGA